ncbi:tigger transposable element-derived protein 1-like [Palaemon carinicauda]|uniref:tigger transposable element-derived protein 1-like n=1 Tax=Palaemon carinicauda TaxID=392227 RepID=UPI0035B59C08
MDMDPLTRKDSHALERCCCFNDFLLLKDGALVNGFQPYFLVITLNHMLASMYTKLEIIKKYEAGMWLRVIAKEYGQKLLMIGTILKQKEAIKAATPSKGITIFSSKKSNVNDEMERLLLFWIKDEEIAGDTITETIICQKASTIFYDIMCAQAEDDNGEAASSDTLAAEAFVRTFDELTVKEGYSPQQVFNCEETGLFRKTRPGQTYITMEEKKPPGHKLMKDRFAHALCANTSVDCKVKDHKVLKDMLPVIWRANEKPWVTRCLFTK